MIVIIRHQFIKLLLMIKPYQIKKVKLAQL